MTGRIYYWFRLIPSDTGPWELKETIPFKVIARQHDWSTCGLVRSILTSSVDLSKSSRF